MHCQPRIACELLRLDDLDGARMVAEAEFQTCSQNEVSRIWASRLVLLEIERLHGNTVQALERLDYWQRVSPPDKDDAKSWTGVAKLRGYYLGLLGRYDSAHQLLQQAEVMACGAGLLELRAEVHLCQAMIFYLQQNYSLSSAIFRAVLSLSGQIGGWYFKGSALWGIGKNLMIENHYHEAIP